MTRKRFLSADHVYRDLAISLMVILVLGPIAENMIGPSLIDSYLTAALLFVALYSITRSTSQVMIGLALGIPAIAGSVYNAATSDTLTNNVVPIMLTTIFIGFLIWHVLKDVLVGTRLRSEQIFGAICAYLLIGFLFAGIYGFVLVADPTALSFSDSLTAAIDGNARGSNGVLTYYSFVTMSTLGYGDISPVSSVARTLAWIEAVVGQLYLAVVIAALVGGYIAKPKS